MSTILCRKCKTAISDKNERCGYCGAKRINTFVISVIITIFLTAAPIAYLLSYANGAEDIASEDVNIESPATDEWTDIPENPAPNEEIAEAPEDKQDVSDKGENKTEEEIWEILNLVLDGATNYYNKFSTERSFTTRHGYLYDITSKAYVGTGALYEAGMLESPYAGAPIYILFIHTIDQAENRLDIHVAYETDDGFAILGKYTTGYVMPRENYQVMIEGYNYIHGEISRPSDDDEDYGTIVAAVMAYGSFESSLDVRYLAKDEKYAVIAVSEVNSPNDISEYVLETVGGKWTVIISHFQNFSDFRVEINERAVNLNMDLLPEFDLKNFTSTLMDDFTQINMIIEATGYLNDDEYIVFEAGAAGFVYQEYSSGKRMVFAQVKNRDGWRVIEASSWREAEAEMKELSKEPPLFLIRQTIS